MNELCKIMLTIDLSNIPDDIVLLPGQISPRYSFDIDTNSPKALIKKRKSDNIEQNIQIKKKPLLKKN